MIYSKDFVPISKEWVPPKWLPPPYKLQPVDEQITKKIREVAKKVIFDPSREIGSQCCSLLNKQLMIRLLNEARKNPLFQQILKLARSKGKIEVVITDKSKFIGSHLADSPAFCEKIDQGKGTPLLHKIVIKHDVSPKMAFSLLVFELINVSQMERFDALDLKVREGELDRENFTILKEYVEFTTTTLAHEILNYGVTHLNWHKDLDAWSIPFQQVMNRAQEKKVDPFVIEWQRVNQKLSKDPISQTHADSYRFQWDCMSKA
jgi:hypothetical protein